jgi:hypothetical protein
VGGPCSVYNLPRKFNTSCFWPGKRPFVIKNHLSGFAAVVQFSVSPKSQFHLSPDNDVIVVIVERTAHFAANLKRRE